MMTNLLRACYLLLFYLLLSGSLIRPLGAAELAISSLKVAYIYNIGKFTRWPEGTWDNGNDSFLMCYYGEDSVAEGLDQLQGKEIDGHPIVVLEAEKQQDFQHCNALYLGTDERRRYRYLLSLIDQNTVLTISDNNPFFDYGGLVNLVEQDQRLRFQVNMQQLAGSQLSFSSKLLKMAILVDDSR